MNPKAQYLRRNKTFTVSHSFFKTGNQKFVYIYISIRYTNLYIHINIRYSWVYKKDLSIAQSILHTLIRR